MTLEDIRVIFQHGFGVKKAREIQKQMKAQRASKA
jgi:MFS transporter, SP family, solute carrier family 2 (myo-inositol transporter), member 13